MMTSSKSNWLCQCLINWPLLSVDPATQGLNGHATLISPLSHRLDTTIELNKMIGRSIIGLLVFVSPSAVLRTITLRIVNAVYGKIGTWLLSHIEQEKFKVFPAITHAIANIKRLKRTLWITALHHIRPGFVSRGTPRSVYSNASFTIISQTSSTTSATSSVILAKELCNYDFIVSAITFAHPAHAFFAFWGQSKKCYQAAKSLVREIYCFHRCKYSVDTIISQGCL